MTPERFYAKSIRQGDCLIWQGKSRVGPYGSVGYNWKHWLAHRLSYFFARGELPDDKVVRHSCDTPLCIEPSHLLLGTHADNVADKVSRNRQHQKETHPLRKISAADVEQIRAEYAKGGVMQKELADRFGISPTQVSRIVRRQRWS